MKKLVKESLYEEIGGAYELKMKHSGSTILPKTKDFDNSEWADELNENGILWKSKDMNGEKVYEVRWSDIEEAKFIRNLVKRMIEYKHGITGGVAADIISKWNKDFYSVERKKHY